MTSSDEVGVVWHARDPARVRRILTACGIDLATRDNGSTATLPSGVIRVTATTADDRLTLEIGPERWQGPDPGSNAPAEPTLFEGPDLLAIGWATVELDRSEAASGRVDSGATHTDDQVAALGATARLLAGRRPTLVLLEPATEGRLAAMLARHGEGPVVLWLVVGEPGFAGVVERLAAAGLRVLGPASGPFGDEVLVTGARSWSPACLIVGRSGRHEGPPFAEAGA